MVPLNWGRWGLVKKIVKWIFRKENLMDWRGVYTRFGLVPEFILFNIYFGM